jgi:hypothetical protein
LTYDYFKSLGFPEDSIQAALLNIELMKELDSGDDDSINKFKIKLIELRKLPFKIFWLLF